VEPIHDKIEPACDDDDDDNDYDNNSDDDDSSTPITTMKTTDSNSTSTTVRYLHLSEVPGKYSMGIFIFPPHAMIPLHDHPGMCVLSRVLYGDLERLSLDLLDASSPSPAASRAPPASRPIRRSTNTIPPPRQSPPPPPLPPLPKGDWPVGTQYARRRRRRRPRQDRNHIGGTAGGAVAHSTALADSVVDHLHAPDCAVLYPYKGNLHQFVAGPYGAAVLDVLLPPYDVHDHRDCTFYEIRNLKDCRSSSSIQSNHVDSMDGDDVDDDDIDHDMDELEEDHDDSDHGNNPSPRHLEQQQHGAQHPHHHVLADDDHDDNLFEDDLCLIVPTGQPEDFHCISGRYRDIGSIP
jgi:PCO_ADO